MGHQQQQQMMNTMHSNQQHSNMNNMNNMRQSIQQQMVAFIQQLQQFPPLFQHLQNNPQVLAQLLQQFRWKQEQQQRQLNNTQNTPQRPPQNNNNNIIYRPPTQQTQIPSLEQPEIIDISQTEKNNQINKEQQEKKLDFSQLKTMRIPIPNNNNSESKKRPFSSIQPQTKQQETKKRRLNNETKRAITISSDSDKNEKEEKEEKKLEEKEEEKSNKKEESKENENGNNNNLLPSNSDDFINDPLISQIATKMSQIRQIANNQKMATPECTASIHKGLDVLLRAIDEYDNDIKMEQEQQRKPNRKNGELFCCEKQTKNGNDPSIQKIKEILAINQSFKLNQNSSLLKKSKNDKEFEQKLKKLAMQFTEYYDDGLLNVFKTCSDPLYKDKFLHCNKSKYFNVWNEIIKQHILPQIDAWLKNYKMKNAVALMFGVMDHIFSYSLYEHLCGIQDKKMFIDQEKKEEESVESEEWIKVSGNLLFSEIENDKKEIDKIAENDIFWLFEYWKKVLLQSEEPVKCLCRSYLINSEPNPYKNRLYVMVSQTPHSPHSTVLPSKSKSISPHIQNRKNIQSQSPSKQKAATPPNHHFIRSNITSMSINGIIKNNPQKNIPSSSVCGKTFVNATECAEHSKHCKECSHRIMSIQADI